MRVRSPEPGRCLGETLGSQLELFPQTRARPAERVRSGPDRCNTAPGHGAGPARSLPGPAALPGRDALPARPCGRCGGDMVEAWYMDESQEDQRTPHRQRPNRAVSLEQLRRLGVVYRRVGLGVHTEGVPRARRAVPRAGPGRAARRGRQAGRGPGQAPRVLVAAPLQRPTRPGAPGTAGFPRVP